MSGDREEKKLDAVIAQLDRAKADLTARVVTTHVGFVVQSIQILRLL